ncbi:MAG: OmpA family protein [Nevskiaceae bacterium]|nr:MAG: OmpA family protein [Nevskiaceae bacterium]
MKKMFPSSRLALAACTLAALPFAAMAGDGAYIGLEGGADFLHHQTVLGDSKFDPGYVGGITGGYAFANGLRPELELNYRYDNLRSIGGSKNVDGVEKAYSAMGNLWYDFKSDHGLLATLHPYVGAGIGYVRPTVDAFRTPSGGPVAFDGHDNVFGYQLGAGAGYDLTRNLTLSLDYRALRTLKADFNAPPAGTASDRYQTQSVMLGLRYSFGAPKAVPVAMPVAAAAPAPAPAAPPRALPAAAPVDSDHDGVPDNLDKCPNTPRGFTVDADGCIVKQTVVLRGVNFELNSDRMTGPARQTLDEVAAALKGQPGLSVEIDGHTDSKGSAAYNLALSKKRAEAVRSYLVGQGVEGRNLTAKGFGLTKPVASNDTEAGRAENRRVEFVVVNAPATVKVVNQNPTEASKTAAEGADKKPAKKAKRKHKAAQ